MIDADYSISDHGNGTYTVSLDKPGMSAAGDTTVVDKSFTGDALGTANFILTVILRRPPELLTAAQATELIDEFFVAPNSLEIE